MVNTFFTLRALADRWHADLAGGRLGDAYSQERDELSLALTAPGGGDEWTLRFSVRAPDVFAFRSEGYHRARRNTATLFEAALDRDVTAIRMAERDRVMFLDLDGGLAFRALLFGPRANVVLVGADGATVEAFQHDEALRDAPAPAPRPAPVVDTFEAFEARWRARKTTEQAVAAAFPLFDRLLAAETCHRAGVDGAASPEALGAAERRALFAAGAALRDAVDAPAPRIYWRGRFADAFSLVPLAHRAAEGEAFDDVDAAVRVYVRRVLGERRFRSLYEPLERALEDAAAHHRRSAERMLDELTNESRADRYEHWGHLLMAGAAGEGPGREEAVLPDVFASGEPVTVPLDAALSSVENAQRYYDRARRTRASRAHAEERLVETSARGDEAERLLAELRALDTLADLERFRKEEGEALARFAGDRVDEVERLPFRRYDLGGGFEVWVGRNAKGNDELTFRHAQKYDLWMHARGVPGSHAVLRKPNRDARPPGPVLERAAAIAAYYSKARGSALVPVMVTERKYVRKPKGAAPGAVLVEREEVLLVAPSVP